MTVLDPLGLIGQVVDGKYAVEAVAGSGGTAIVYRAMHLAWQRRVALKVVRVLGDMSGEHRDILFAQLTQEAVLLASLSERTSAIVQARDIGHVTTSDGHWAPYLVLEWVEGCALDVVLDSERARGVAPRGVEEAARLLEPVAQGLALAHQHGIAHRDVKPGNIFVLGDPRSTEATTKILDFGIAKVVADAHAREGGFRRTDGGFSPFTPAYGAPEQFSRELGSTGPWTDVFGLALVLAEVATGREVFVGDTVAMLAAAASSRDSRPSLRRGGALVSDAVEAVFVRAVAVDPSMRPQNAGELWRELRAALLVDQRPLYDAAAPALALDSITGLKSAGSLVSAPVSYVGPASAEGGAPADRSELPTTTGLRTTKGELVVTEPTRRGAVRRTSLWVLALALPAALLATVVTLRGQRPTRAPIGVVASAAPAAPPSMLPPVTACPDGAAYVPGGKFFMGSDEAVALPFERPAHKVSVHAFCMDVTEVTVSAYKRCSDRGDCRRASIVNEWADIGAAERKTYDPLCNMREPEARGAHPINCVDWRMADEYCRAESRRLPTEAEWELAARGPDGRMYPWGDEAPSGTLLNACGSECAGWGRAHKAEVFAMYKENDGWPTTAPVGSFPKGASRYGIQDVVGNVWEWVADRYAPYTDEEIADPAGPSRGEERVIRGGAWNGSQPAWVRPTFRYKDAPEKKSHGIGFRCAAAPK